MLRSASTMTPLHLAADSSLHPSPGTLNAAVSGEQLLVPAEVYALLRRHGLPSVEGLLSYLDTFPTQWASEFGWQVEEIKEARRGLAVLLSGHVPDAFLSPPTPQSRGFGALPPDSRNR